MTRVTEAGDLAKRVAGWLFLVVPFMPLRLLFDDPPGSSGLPGPGEWMLGLLVCAGVAWLASRRFPLAVERSADALAGVLRFPPFPAFLLAVLAALAALLTATSLAAFSRRPLLVDTIAQLFQAKIFAGGVAWVPAPELGAFFATQHMVSDAGRWYAQYPPGHPAALAIGVWAGAPWLVPILFSLLSAWLVIDTARHIFGEAVGRVTAVLLVLAPFFWFMAASHMNHVSSHLHISLFLWCFARWAGTGPRPRVGDAAPRGWILAAGLALGAAFVTRPLTALAVGGALALPALRLAAPCRCRRSGWRRPAAGRRPSLGRAASSASPRSTRSSTLRRPATRSHPAISGCGGSHTASASTSPPGANSIPLSQVSATNSSTLASCRPSCSKGRSPPSPRSASFSRPAGLPWQGPGPAPAREYERTPRSRAGTAGFSGLSSPSRRPTSSTGTATRSSGRAFSMRVSPSSSPCSRARSWNYSDISRAVVRHGWEASISGL
ncbi:glycosyltransferase family 39 protein [Candidatus Palauibacter sp.]|uniref:glycosyltransferase family 39 protein n=1 Tax=Candidatus Palauibacter sp. TaxID=3101350 RepID=UPI003CC61861